MMKSALRMATLACGAFIVVLAVAEARAETNALPLYEKFEPAGGYWDYKVEWHAFDAPANRYTDCPTNWAKPHLDYCPYDPSNAPNIPAPAPSDSWTWGPYKFESWPDKDNGGRVFSGQRSGRQPIWDPMWGRLYHIFTMPAPGLDLRFKTQMWDPANRLCDCDQEWIRDYCGYAGYVCTCGVTPPCPSRPNYDDNGGIEVSTPNRRETYLGLDKDAFYLGINSHHSWTHYCWYSVSDGWVVSSVPRSQAWHLLEIVVHPYTGGLDVEFMLDGVQIAQGHRMPGPSGTGVDLSYAHIGGDPALITERHTANTFEEFWYDEVALTGCRNPRPDVDGDGDVDQADFGAFQSCITGPADPFLQANALFDRTNCQCLDLNGDEDVDDDDLVGFVDCISGPGAAADLDCDH